MAFTTYSTLQTAVINALHRADLASVLPDLITLAEDKLNKRLRIRPMETRVTSSVSSEYLALPSRFLSIKNFQVNTAPRRRIEYATPEWLDVKFPDSTNTGVPRFYSFVGGQIQLAPVPDATYTVEMDYYQSWALATDTTNWLLTNAPRTYYYGSLLEAVIYLKDDKRIAQFEPLFELAVKEVVDSDESDSHPDYGLQIRPEGQVV